MVLLERLRPKSSTISGLGAVLFASGVVLLFVSLYKNASETAWSPLPIVALCVLAAAVGCWIAAAALEEQPNSAFDVRGTIVLRPKDFRRSDNHVIVTAKKTRKPTGWNRPLAYPLTLRDGTEIATLRQAATLMMGLPETRKSKPVWQHAAELLMLAHKSGKAADVQVATDQLFRALQLEGWM